MNMFLSFVVLFIISDTVAATVGTFILYRYHESPFIRSMGRVLGAFALEQSLTLAALSIDPVRVRHIWAYHALILSGRLIRSIAIWKFTLRLFGVIKSRSTTEAETNAE